MQLKCPVGNLILVEETQKNASCLVGVDLSNSMENRGSMRR